MEKINNTAISIVSAPVFRDQILTISHLIEFKEQLLSEIKELLEQQSSQQPKLQKQWLKAFEIRKLLRFVMKGDCLF